MEPELVFLTGIVWNIATIIMTLNLVGAVRRKTDYAKDPRLP